MSFWQEVEETDKKGIFKSDDSMVSYPTGITVLDYANGFWNETVDENGNKIQVPVTGIQGGSMISIISETGGGKALPNSTMIPTPSGYRRFDTLQVGDTVFNANGSPVKILGVYPQGIKNVYEVTFKDGRIAKCCQDHLWTVISPDGKRETVALKDLFKVYIDSNKYMLKKNRYSVPMNEPVQYNSTIVPVDPWVLGILIGKGHLNSTHVELRSKDNVLPNKVAKKLNCEAKLRCRTSHSYVFTSKETGNLLKVSDLFKDLTEVIGKRSYEKTIPDIYKFNDINTRFSVLAGLLDGIGAYNVFTGRIKLNTSSKKLADDVIELAHSLGCLVYLKEKSDKRFNISIQCNDEHKALLFTYGKNYIHVLIAAQRRNRRKYNTLEIINIREVGVDEQRCIVVDDPKHLFLTENYVVTHNSTFAIQIGWNIVKRFEDGMLFIIDCEKTNLRQRIANLTNTKYDESRIKLIKSHTTIEDVLDMFNKLCDVKEAGGKKYMYETKNGARSSWHYIPTVVIIDSLPAFNSKEYNVEDLGNNIDQMKASKDITRFYTNVLDRAWKYNFIFIVINHIRPNTVMNPYAQPPRGLLMINSQTESLPRGFVAQYYSNTYFRIKTKRSAAYTIEDDGFAGYKCEISLAKSKTNVVGTSFPVTFNSAKGFDPIYSMYEFASSLGLVQGRNPYLTIKGFEERKFNRKEFISLMSVDKEFREGVLKVLKPYYEGLLGTRKEEDENETEETVLEYGDIDLNSV